MKLASGSLDFVRNAIRRFWASDAYDIDPETLRITHPTKDMNAAFRVVRGKRGRYIFESVAREDRR